MITVGNRYIPSTFIRNIDLDDKTVVITFFLGHKLRINFNSRKVAELEFTKTMERLKKLKRTCSLVN